MIEYLQDLDRYSWQLALILIIAGFVIGFINTLAGSGSVITFIIFDLLGMPIKTINGSVRLNIIFSTLTASVTFKKQNVLDYKQAFRYAIPAILGSVIGAVVANQMEEKDFKLSVAFLMIIILAMVVFKPSQWLKGREENFSAKPTFIQWLLLVGVGFYGGYIHIGIGILMLSTLVVGAGLDLVKANALKVFIILLTTPIALVIFMLYGQMDYYLGLLPSMGSIPGAYFASRWAVKFGSNFVRWILIVVTLFFVIKLFADIFGISLL